MAEHKRGQDIGANTEIVAQTTSNLMLRKSLLEKSWILDPERTRRKSIELSGASGDYASSARPGNAWCPGDGPEELHM